MPRRRKFEVFVFGDGESGELALGSRNATNVKRPRRNEKLGGVVSLSAGGMHGVALTSDHKVLTWGVNDHKALGRDTSWDGGLRDVADTSDSEDNDSELNPLESTPGLMASGELPSDARATQAVAGDSTTLVLSEGGLVYGCGTFRDGSGACRFTLDKSTREPVEYQPTLGQIRGLSNITSVAVGDNFALALDASGVVFAWGSGEQHQLGRKIVERRRLLALLPAKLGLPKRCKIRSIHAGADHAFAIDRNGDTWAWGLNNWGQTGIPANAGRDEASIIGPQKVAALAGRRMKMISGGRHHSIGITEDGACLVWGRADGGQLGVDSGVLANQDEKIVLRDARGKPRALLTPTKLPIPGRCVFAAAGSDHSIVLNHSGKAFSFGFNVSYQCGQGNEDDILVPTMIDNTAVRGARICWAGAGGQYSMLAAYKN